MPNRNYQRILRQRQHPVFLDYLTKPGEVNFHMSPTSWLRLRPQGEAVPIITIRAGEDISTMPIELPVLLGVIPPILVLLTCRRVLDIHAPPDAASVNISFVEGVRSVGGDNLITAIPGFVSGGNIGMVRKINNFCSKIMFLV